MPSPLNEPKALWNESVGLASVLLQSELCASWGLRGRRSVDGDGGTEGTFGSG